MIIVDHDFCISFFGYVSNRKQPSLAFGLWLERFHEKQIRALSGPKNPE
jgi:hypothetical protein